MNTPYPGYIKWREIVPSNVMVYPSTQGKSTNPTNSFCTHKIKYRLNGNQIVDFIIEMPEFTCTGLFPQNSNSGYTTYSALFKQEIGNKDHDDFIKMMNDVDIAIRDYCKNQNYQNSQLNPRLKISDGRINIKTFFNSKNPGEQLGMFCRVMIGGGFSSTKLRVISSNEPKGISVENNLILEKAKFSIIPTVTIAEIYVGKADPSYRNYLTCGIVTNISQASSTFMQNDTMTKFYGKEDIPDYQSIITDLQNQALKNNNENEKNKIASTQPLPGQQSQPQPSQGQMYQGQQFQPQQPSQPQQFQQPLQGQMYQPQQSQQQQMYQGQQVQQFPQQQPLQVQQFPQQQPSQVQQFPQQQPSQVQQFPQQQPSQVQQFPQFSAAPSQQQPLQFPQFSAAPSQQDASQQSLANGMSSESILSQVPNITKFTTINK